MSAGPDDAFGRHGGTYISKRQHMVSGRGARNELLPCTYNRGHRHPCTTKHPHTHRHTCRQRHKSSSGGEELGSDGCMRWMLTLRTEVVVLVELRGAVFRDVCERRDDTEVWKNLNMEAGSYLPGICGGCIDGAGVRSEL